MEVDVSMSPATVHTATAEAQYEHRDHRLRTAYCGEKSTGATGSAFAGVRRVRRPAAKRPDSERRGTEGKTPRTDAYKEPKAELKHSPPETLPPKLDVVLELPELVRLDRLVPRHHHLADELPASPVQSTRISGHAKR